MYKDQLRARKRKQAARRLVLWLFLALGAGAGAVHILFFSGAFTVEEIKISLPEQISGMPVQERVNSWLDEERFYVSRRDNAFLVNTDNLAAFLLNQFPEINNVEITEDFPHVLELNIQGREPFGVWCLDVECYYFDEDGIAFRQALDTEGFLLAKIIDLRDRTFNLGELVESAVWRNNIFTVTNLLNPDISVRHFMVSRDSFNEFDAVINTGVIIHFSNSTDIESQITAFNIAWKENITEQEKTSMQYVDLRVPDRIYYK